MRTATWFGKLLAPLLSALSLATFATAVAAAPPLLSETQLLPGDTQITPAAGRQDLAQIAAGGGGFLAVWEDSRTDVLGPYAFDVIPLGGGSGMGSMRDIYAVRLDADGNPIGETIFVSQAQYDQGFPRVAWNGANWLVVWETVRPAGNSKAKDIVAARVAPDGTVLDTTPIVVAGSDVVDEMWPAVASDGTNWVIAWHAWGTSPAIRGARVSPAGVVLDPSGVVLRSTTTNSTYNCDIAYTDSKFMLVWSEDNATKARRFSTTLTPLDASPIVIDSVTGGSTKTYVAANGTDFLVGWTGTWSPWTDIRGCRVTAGGQRLDANGGFVIANAQVYECGGVAWDGTQWVVVWNDNVSDVLASRVSAQGVVLDPGGVVIKPGAAIESEPAVAGGSGGVRIIWTDARAQANFSLDGLDIYTARFVSNGTVGPDACATLGAPRQLLPQIAAGTSGYLVSFASEISGVRRIFAQRVDALGDPVDLEPILLASSTGYLTTPAVAFDGVNYLVAWANASDGKIYARRVAEDGTLLDAAAIEVMVGFQPTIAALNGVFLVAGVWPATSELHYVNSMRVRGSDGAKLDASQAFLGANFDVAPDVIALGSRWLVVWERHGSHDQSSADIRARFIRPDGQPDGAYFAISNYGPNTSPTVTSDGSAALVLWSAGDLYRVRIMPDGSLVGSGTLHPATVPGAQTIPAAAWTGTEYAVTYFDSRNDLYPEQVRGDIYATRADASGAATDPAGFAVANNDLPELSPNVAGADGRALFVFSTFQPESPYAAYRIGIRRMDAAATAVGDAQGIGSSSIARLHQATPNPASSSIAFRYELGRSSRVAVRVYDMSGALVRTVVDAVQSPGQHAAAWDGRSDSGSDLASGVYLYRLVAEGYSETRKLTLLK
jgi:FlgD Ig-like domain